MERLIYLPRFGKTTKSYPILIQCLTVSKRILLCGSNHHYNYINQWDFYTRLVLWIDILDTFQYEDHMSRYMDCIINVKRLSDRCIFIIGIPIHVRRCISIWSNSGHRNDAHLKWLTEEKTKANYIIFHYWILHYTRHIDSLRCLEGFIPGDVLFRANNTICGVN